MEGLRSYSSPKAKLTRLLKSGKLMQIRRGLFVDDLSIPPKTLAPILYGPSYISFQSALAACGLIPESVTVILSASYNKNKDKTSERHWGHTSTCIYPLRYIRTV